MAHFAKLDKDNNVIDVVVVDNKDLKGQDYPNADAIGSKFLNDNGFTGKWIQTSYSASFRKNPATVNSVYDPSLNAFINYQKPHEECIWDESKLRWVPPPGKYGVTH